MKKKLDAAEKNAGRGGDMRQAMPEATRLVDELRRHFGRQWVDDALRQGLRLQRERARIAEQRGAAAADAWLRQQRCPGPSLRLVEGALQVGELPGGGAAR